MYVHIHTVNWAQPSSDLKEAYFKGCVLFGSRETLFQGFRVQTERMGSWFRLRGGIFQGSRVQIE